MPGDDEDDRAEYEAVPGDAPRWRRADELQRDERRMVRKFREQIHALGGLWIFLGVLVGGVTLMLNKNNNPFFGKDATDDEIQLLVCIYAGLSACWLFVGLASCLKQIWAVYFGLGLSYLSLFGQIVTLNLCGLIIVILVILQAHRVIKWAGELNAAGIPLDTRLK